MSKNFFFNASIDEIEQLAEPIDLITVQFDDENQSDLTANFSLSLDEID